MRNVSFHLEDIFHDDAARTVRNAVDNAHLDGGYCLVVGVHLCGDLSRRAVQLWRGCGADALVLCPCCLPRRRRADAFGFHVVDLARKMRVDGYGLWCTMLYGLLAAGGSDHLDVENGGMMCNMCVDEDVTSPQRSFLTAVRRGPGLEGGGEKVGGGSRHVGVVPGRGAGKWRIVA
jgi:hypothetical protein